MTKKNIINSRRLIILFLLSVGLTVGLSQVAFAQDAAASQQGEAGAKIDESISIIDQIKQGGQTMWVLGLLSVSWFALVVYNTLKIKEHQFLQTEVVKQLQDPLDDLHIERAKALCEENPGTITNILGAGLDRIRSDEIDLVAIEKAMEDKSTEEMAGPFVYINYLNVIAGVSPMVGLLGTVIGMVKAFHSIAAEGMGKPELLAGNISEALITTATGLIIAIPALISYFYFKNKYGKLSSRVSRILGDLYYSLVHAVNRIS